MKSICTVNGKGGVGKTTVSRHIANDAVARGLRVLSLDLDPQGDLTKSLQYQNQGSAQDRASRRRLLSWDQLRLPELPAHAGAHGLFESSGEIQPLKLTEQHGLLGASPELADVLSWPLDCALTVKQRLSEFDGVYDLCVIDTPPTISNLVVSAMACAHYMIIPTDLSIDSISGLLETSLKVDLVRTQFNPDLELIGVVLNKVNRRRAADMAMRDLVLEHFYGAVLDAELDDRAGVRSTSFQPIWESKKGESDRKAATEMRAFCEAVFNRMDLSN